MLGGERSGGDGSGGDMSGEDGSGGDGSGKNQSVGDGSVRNGSVAKKVAADLPPFNWLVIVPLIMEFITTTSIKTDLCL
jgi:hypothetical protein